MVRAEKIINRILAIIYFPLSLFSFLLCMASESTIGANNPLFVCLINVFVVVAFIIPFLCFACIFGAMILRNKGYTAASFVIRFVPLVLFALNQLLLAFAETLPRKL